jgi:hypothetical protein
MKYLKIFLAVFSLAVIAEGLLFEKHRVYSQGDTSFKTLNGAAYIEMATVDGLILKAGKLYDAYSGTSSKEGKDCKT